MYNYTIKCVCECSINKIKYNICGYLILLIITFENIQSSEYYVYSTDCLNTYMRITTWYKLKIRTSSNNHHKTIIMHTKLLINKYNIIILLYSLRMLSNVITSYYRQDHKILFYLTIKNMLLCWKNFFKM